MFHDCIRPLFSSTRADGAIGGENKFPSSGSAATLLMLLEVCCKSLKLLMTAMIRILEIPVRNIEIGGNLRPDFTRRWRHLCATLTRRHRCIHRIFPPLQILSNSFRCSAVGMVFCFWFDLFLIPRMAEGAAMNNSGPTEKFEAED